MSGDFPFVAKLVSPAKCNEKPWDLWVSEIGHASPRRDDEGAALFAAPAAADKPAPRLHPYKAGAARSRRAGLHRLRHDSMSLHGLFPQMDNLNAAVCHMCGVVVKCSAAYRHLLESHTGSEPILPPPPPAPTVKLKGSHKSSRYKPERKVELPPPPPPPVDILPVPMEASPLYAPTAPLSRIVLPQPDLQYLEEPGTSSAVTGEVQICVETGELPVVSIQDTEDLPLGENITDDIVDIMNSEGIQSADDISNAADWKNIIRDIGKMQDLNFPQTTDTVQPQDLFTPVDASLAPYTMTDTDLSSLQFAPNTSPMLASVIDANMLSAQMLKPVTPAAQTNKPSRAKTKSKFNLREYDPNKHCGVVTADNPKPCTRSLTCKAHALSLRRTVEGRAKPFDTLLAEHRAARDAPPPAPLQAPLLVSAELDLSAFNGLTAEQQVNDIYASLVSLEDAQALPDTSSITSLLSQPLPAEPFLLPDEAEEPARASPPPQPPALALPLRADSAPPPPLPGDVCWYAACPRPLALCTFNASHAGGAVTLGKKFATVRSNIKSSLSRSQCKTGATNNFYYNQNVSLSKTVHMNNASKTNKPEVRKLIVTCSAGGGTKVQQTLSELFGGELRAVNGHVGHAGHLGHAGHGQGGHALLGAGKARAPGKGKRPALDLAFGLDPLLDEKC